MSNSAERRRARVVLRKLLSGERVDGLDARGYGEWTAVVQDVYEAYQNTGVLGAKSAFNPHARDNPALLSLISFDEQRQQMTRGTMREVLTTVFPEPRWTVPDILPQGFSLLSGRPKVGKSWLALQIAIAVGTGGVALGRTVERGKVLYLALEDSLRRIQSRATKQQAPVDADIMFETGWVALGEGGLAELQSRISDEGYSLVVIDTLSRVLGRADQLDLAEMTTLLGELQKISQLHETTILCVDHLRKPNTMISNPVDDIIGSTGKAAIADAMLVLYREYGKHDATLRITGRDIEENDFVLSWDAMICCWTMQGEAGQVRKDTLRARILDAIKDLNDLGQTATTKNIAVYVERNTANVSHEIAELLRAGLIVKAERVGREQPYSLVKRE